MTKAFNLVIFVLVTIFIVSCDSPVNTSSIVTPIEKTIKIAVSNTPLSSPFFIAEKQGYFAKHNLNVELVRLDGGIKCFDALINKQADFATASETVVMFNSFKKIDFSVMASFVESDNDVKLLSLTPQKYDQLNNLANARIGVVKGSASEFFLDSLLIMYNKIQQPIERVYLSSTELIPALINHEVDIISAWEPLSYVLANQIKVNPEVINSRGLYHLSFNLMGLKDSDITKKQKLALLRALNDATVFINQYPEKSQETISNTLNIDPAQLKYSWNDYTFRLSLSNALFSNIQTQGQWAIDNQLVPIKQNIDFRQVFDRKLIESYIEKEAGW